MRPILQSSHVHPSRKDMMSKLIYTLFLSTIFLSNPELAYAQSLGDMMCSVSHNLAPFEKLFVGLAYITGAILMGSGLYQLSYFTDAINASRQFGVSRPKGYIVSGAILLALPAFLNWTITTMFGYSQHADLGGGLSGCLAYVGAGGHAGDVGLDGLMTNLVMNIKSPMVFMLSVICILMGIFYVFRGLVKASKFGQDAKSSIPVILTNITVGTIIYTIGTSMNMIMATVFGDSTIAGSNVVVNAIAADFGADTGAFQSAVYAALTFFQLVGMIAFIRGWIILKDACEGQSQKSVPQGLTHIIGGVLAVNIYRFLEVMDTSFGTGFL